MAFNDFISSLNTNINPLGYNSSETPLRVPMANNGIPSPQTPTANNMHKYAYLNNPSGMQGMRATNLEQGGFKTYTTPTSAPDNTKVPFLDPMLNGDIRSGSGYGSIENEDGTRSYAYLPQGEQPVATTGTNRPTKTAASSVAPSGTGQPPLAAPAPTPVSKSRPQHSRITIPNYHNSADSRYTVNPVEQPTNASPLAQPRYLGGDSIGMPPKNSYNPSHWSDNVKHWASQGWNNIKNFYGFNR